MRLFLLILLVCSLSSRLAAGQSTTLSGQVLDSLTRKPLELASVFLANTTRGISTDAEGKFTLRNVPPGQYTLVASYLGYQLFKRTIVVAQAPPQPRTLLLAPTANQLREVVVRPGHNRPEDYALFVRQFLGNSSFSQQCKIRNPDHISVDYDARSNVLTAFTPYQLQVDNEALGYRLTFYGLELYTDFGQHFTQTSSQVVFEELPARTAHQQRRWARNRRTAYLGSLTHFLRSVYQRRVQEEGFQVQSLRLELNRRRAWADTFALNHSALGHRRLPAQVVRYLGEPQQTPLLSGSLPLDSLSRWQTGPTRVWLRFPAMLAVTYRPETQDPAYQRQFSTAARRSDNAQRSVLHLRTPEAEITFSGKLLTDWAVVTEGYWAFEKIGEMLPADYEPTSTEKR